MMVFKTNFHRRGLSDDGAATLVTGIISMMVLLLCLGFGVDLSKNAYLKNAQNSKAQESVESAVKTVDSRGSLANFNTDASGNIPDAVYKVVSEYKNQDSSSYVNALVGAGQHMDEAAQYKSVKCAERPVYKWGSTTKAVAKMPYMVIKIDENRGYDDSSGSVVYTVEGNDPPEHVSGEFKPGVTYHVVSAEIQDASANFMLGMFGMGCQGYDSKVSAISFGSQQDIAQNN